eukprot:TRINITY_DN13738_c0_g3_i1.p1 TRINITY_DN13738_c0_g3~~TRINITY_DN13738_c0_g3_i1.p1  ORF type:complete len:202 (+),score=-11.69 TRINITY_DN13738_c0_g3_i1:236-841(+)
MYFLRELRQLLKPLHYENLVNFRFKGTLKLTQLLLVFIIFKGCQHCWCVSFSLQNCQLVYGIVLSSFLKLDLLSQIKQPYCPKSSQFKYFIQNIRNLKFSSFFVDIPYQYHQEKCHVKIGQFWLKRNRFISQRVNSKLCDKMNKKLDCAYFAQNYPELTQNWHQDCDQKQIQTTYECIPKIQSRQNSAVQYYVKQFVTYYY